MIRLVADTNVYVSAAISPRSAAARLIDAARRGKAGLIMCGALYDEMVEVLEREKFRRWITLDEAHDFVAAMALLAEWVDDRAPELIPQVCSDPDDNFLVALCQDAHTSILVSGDGGVQEIMYPNIEIYSPAAALDLLEYRHEWGEGLIPADPRRSQLAVEAEGSVALISVYATFSGIFQRVTDLDEARQILGFVTVPSAIPNFIADFDHVREMIKDRGLGTRPEFASPSVAYLKLPPDPGVTLLAQGQVELPADTIYATLLRCPDLADPPGMRFDHWRVFGIGGQWPIERIPPRPV